MHFDIRKQLLSYDNVMNKQREAVYKERAAIISDDDIKERTWDILSDTLDNIASPDKVFSADTEEPDINAAATRLKALFWPGIDAPLKDVAAREDLDAALEKIRADLKDSFDKKIAEMGSETAESIFRYILLQSLDDNWREHLLGMDELRRGIGLRAIGQKDPLVEYQFESFTLFQQMLQTIREHVAEYALRVRVVTDDRTNRRRGMRESRDMLLPGAGMGMSEEARAAAQAAGDAKPQPIRRGPKTGRNDPCPCGSGKKYKHCHGRDAGGSAAEDAPKSA
jgi:preprotein translocase subunit SecA